MLVLIYLFIFYYLELCNLRHWKIEAHTTRNVDKQIVKRKERVFQYKEGIYKLSVCGISIRPMIHYWHKFFMFDDILIIAHDLGSYLGSSTHYYMDP